MIPRHRAGYVRQPVFFGWRVVGTAFVTTFFGAGIGYFALSEFLRTLHAEHGWPVSTISSAVSLHFAATGVTMVYVPDLHRRIGLVAATRAGSGLLAAGAIVWATCAHPGSCQSRRC
jgi:hypothetical protein